MKQLIQRVPLPISGVALGMAALGNLLQSYSEVLRLLCGGLAALFLLLLILKAVLCPDRIVQDLKDPVIAGVAATFPMSLMLLSVYVKPYIGTAALVVWYIALAMHICLILYVSLHFVAKFVLTNMVPSFFIVYAGIVVGSVTAPAYQLQALGNILFWVGFLPYLAILVAVTYRYIKLPKLPNPAKPLLCIYTAPMSLCVAGYVQSVSPKSATFLLVIFIAALCLYAFALIWSLCCIRLPFYPSYASFTFPFVISAIAAKMTLGAMAKLGQPLPWLEPLVLAMTVVAAVWTCYTYLRFILFLTEGHKPTSQ
ncbi:MAG: TDT family transporter [Eubacteriales bacterium]|nr:TDT family transporter [Eubacteriales bacterium]